MEIFQGASGTLKVGTFTGRGSVDIAHADCPH